LQELVRQVTRLQQSIIWLLQVARRVVKKVCHRVVVVVVVQAVLERRLR
jgi:hypothetical protein